MEMIEEEMRAFPEFMLNHHLNRLREVNKFTRRISDIKLNPRENKIFLNDRENERYNLLRSLFCQITHPWIKKEDLNLYNITSTNFDSIALNFIADLLVRKNIRPKDFQSKEEILRLVDDALIDVRRLEDLPEVVWESKNEKIAREDPFFYSLSTALGDSLVERFDDLLKFALDTFKHYSFHYADLPVKK
jgi:hypothetical protein